MEKAKSFEDLIVWQKSNRITLEVYKITEKLPTSEKYNLVSQMRRASVSVQSNIAEGFSKRGKKDKINFYNISLSSLQELKNYFRLVKDLGYIRDSRDIIDKIDEVGKLLNGLSNSIKMRKW
ncbi:four helix bundle protein [Candidatus Peregrinibacteria bacterium]|nr:four helix bundle protein [Candidatus Peregrinibacteria bacterium]